MWIRIGFICIFQNNGKVHQALLMTNIILSLKIFFIFAVKWLNGTQCADEKRPCGVGVMGVDDFVIRKAAYWPVDNQKSVQLYNNNL